MKLKKFKTKQIHLTIDPGITGTGYVVWTKNWEIITTGIVSCNSIKDWQKRGEVIALGMQKVATRYKCTHAYIEFPALHQSLGGQVTAKSGALVKLSWFVGLCCSSLTRCKIELVHVRDWKGQLPKDVVERRIDKIYPDNTFKSHIYDAVGIGLFKAGRF